MDNTEPTTSYDKRKQLLDAARDLSSIMREVTLPINKLICKLEEEADKYLKDTIDERIYTPRSRKKVVYDNRKAECHDERPPAKESKRACSICREPGHRSPNCPKK